MPLDLDSCIAGVFTPGNIGASSGLPPVEPVMPLRAPTVVAAALVETATAAATVNAGLVRAGAIVEAVTAADTVSGAITVLAAAVAEAVAAASAQDATITAGGDPYFSNVKLLMGFEGADAATGSPGMTDESGAAHGTATVAGNAQIDTAQFKFGASSLLLDGTGDYLTFADSADWAFGAGQFTIELWVQYNSVTDAEFISQWDISTSACGFKIGRTAASGLVFNFYDNTTTLRAVTNAWTPVANTWYHVAVDRDGSGVVRIYVGGVMLNKATLSQTCADSAKALSIGRIDHSTPRYLNGWIDEVRITKGVARYASDAGYTVPTAAFPRS